MGRHCLGNQILHEILALEFVKNINHFSLQEKADILVQLARSDIDASNVIQSAHAVVASTLHAFSL